MNEECILVVEDDPGVAVLEKRRLERAGYRVLMSGSAPEAFQLLTDNPVDLIVLDYRLPGGLDGLQFYEQVRGAGQAPPVILVTGFGNEATVIRALRAGVRDFVSKSPEYLDYLPEAVEHVLRQVRTERELAESRAELSAIIDSAKDAILIVEANQRITLFNAAAEKMFGLPAKDAVGQHLSNFVVRDLAPDNPPETPGSVSRVVRSGQRGIRADGQSFPLEAAVSRATVSGRTFYSIVVRDISERTRAEGLLRASEERYRGLFEDALTGNVVSTPQGQLLACNSAFARIFGFESVGEALGCNLLALYPNPQARANLLRLLRERKALTLHELELRRRDGTPVHLIGNFVGVFNPEGELVRINGYLLDISDRKKLEEQLRQAQKLEAIGRLAGGIAHDFNNLLTVINGYSEVLLASAPPGDTRDFLAEIHKAADRAAGLTRQLLAFSRKQVLQPEVLDLNSLVAQSEKMLRRLIGEDVDLATSLAPDLGQVKVDPGQVEQVILNLVVNARDAMPTGGLLTLETRNVRLDETYLRDHAGVEPGRYVMLAVADTGCGMDRATRSQIFKPFFTTKEPGKGTGLGLSTVFGIVKQSNGHVEVYSEPGKGTTFKVYLPRVSEAAASVHSLSQIFAPKGSETILLVEDEQGVRSLASLALRVNGYTVLEASDGEEAFQLCRTNSTPIQLLVTDLVMPRMSGRQLAQAVSTLRPDLKVLYLSGYTDDAVVRHGLVANDVWFLQKPFTPNVLARKVREVLDKPGPSSN